MDTNQLKKLIQDTLHEANLHSIEATNLLLGTCAQESSLGQYIRQLGNGPALGIFQMEPATFNDIFNNFLKYKPSLQNSILQISYTTKPQPEMLVWNLKLSILMCRIHYLRVPRSIPKTLEEQAHYWKRYYNTYLGAGKVEEYIKNYHRYIL